MTNLQCKPKLSVIIPVYGTEKYIGKCLESVIQQSWKNIEVLVIDDATKDNAAKIAEEYAERYDSIKVIHHPQNKGLFRAKVTGLSLMTGDYFAFLDSDDTVTVDFYRLMIRKALQTDAEIVAGDFVEVHESGEMYYPNRALQQMDADLTADEVLSGLLAQEGLDYGWHITCNKIYSRRLRDELLCELEKVKRHLIMCEDVAFSILFFSCARKFVNVHGEYYLYFRNQSASTSNRALSYERCDKAVTDILYAFEIAENYLKKRDLYQRNEAHLKAWKSNLGLCWKANVEQCRCTKKQRKEIEEKLANLLVQEKIANRDFFDRHQVLFSGLEQQEIKTAILSPECKYVSFDVFDTLLLRPFWTPSDLFLYMEPDVTRLVETIDNVEFHLLRVEAEKNARRRKISDRENAFGEITIDEIYIELASMCPALSPYVEQIKQMEVECESRFCSARLKGKELLELALEAGKQVICVSDMYLPSQAIKKILAKNGYEHISYCFVSGEIGLSKAHGALYSYVARQLGCQARNIVHIGDNYRSDYEKAREQGWHAFYLPKTIDCMTDQVPNHFYGNVYYKAFRNDHGPRLQSSGVEGFMGNRCLMAVAANKVFDDPFIPVMQNSDYNADPKRIGYLAFGSYLLGIASWITDLVKKEQFKQVNFVARDGWLPLQAFDVLKSAFSLPVKNNYIYASRKTIAPLLLKNPAGIYSMPENYNLYTLTPQKFIELFRPTIKPGLFVRAREVMEAHGIVYEIPFYEIGAFEKFAEVFLKNFYDKNLAEEYCRKVGNYYAPYFAGHSATFDIGYSGRLESVLKSLYGFDITALYLYINKDRALIRKRNTGIGLETFGDYTPTVAGSIREHIISLFGPSCIGFDCSGENAVPIMEEFKASYAAEYVTKQLQESALQFVIDVCRIFGKDLEWLPFRKEDACLLMENFLNYAMPNDSDLFMAIPFEDDMGVGELTIRDIWQQGMLVAGRGGGAAALQDDRLNYYKMPKLKKWLVWCLVDRKTLKDTAKRKLAKYPRILNLCSTFYGGLRRLAHGEKKIG